MSLLAQFEALTDAGERRGSDRRALRLAITATLSQNPELAATIHDLSETGFLLETFAPLAGDQPFQVFLPLVGSVEARVVWRGGHFYGCQFSAPVARAAVSAALLKSVPVGVADATAETGPDIVSQLHDMNARIERIGQDLDRAIEDFSIGQAPAPTADPEEKLAAALPRSAIRSPPEFETPAQPERFYEPLPSSEGDAAQWVVIVSLVLSGLAALILIAALLGIPGTL